MIDIGSGEPIVLIPGIQGRWEWLRPTVDALAERWRVITGSLPGEPDSRGPRPATFDDLVNEVESMMDAAELETAVVCGVSFGGLIALRYAATRTGRVRGLILVSPPGPYWQPSEQQASYIRRPALMFPLFVAGAINRIAREIRVTFPKVSEQISFCVRWAWQVVRAPGVPTRMGLRARLAQREQFIQDCPRVAAPTLIIAGERQLDMVVNQDESLAYLAEISGARFQLFERTGHLGVVTRPERFADLIADFVRGLA